MSETRITVEAKDLVYLAQNYHHDIKGVGMKVHMSTCLKMCLKRKDGKQNIVGKIS